MTAGKLLSFSLSSLKRDWRAGELRILALALVIAVSCVSAVGFFIDRVERGVEQQSAELIAAELVVSSSQAVSQEIIDDAQQRGLKTAATLHFRSISLAAEKPQLVEVKAVSHGYPFRGVLRVADAPFAADREINSIPVRGEVWVDPRLTQILGISVGDELQLGAISFTISQVLTDEPDRGGDMFSVAPRVMINMEDIPATQLLSPGALVSHRLLIDGEASKLAAFRSKLEADKPDNISLLDIREARPELRVALERAQQFLGLASIVSVLLAGIAIATATRRFSRRHFNSVAIYRCLGATQKSVIILFCLELLWLALLASTAGIALGLLAQSGISLILDKLFLSSLPAPTIQPAIAGYATGVILLLGFALPPLLSLKDISPMRVLRRDQMPTKISNGVIYLALTISMSSLLFWQVKDFKMVIAVMLGMLATISVLALAAFLLIRLLAGLRQHTGVAWRYGLANIVRRRNESIIQIVAFGLTIMVLLLLSTVRNDLLDGWKKSLPDQAPNHFMINVQTDQVAGVQEFFQQQGVKKPGLHAMVRARLTRINGRVASIDDYSNERARHKITREFNLSPAAKLQIDNVIKEGRWWTDGEHGKPLMSIESKLAKILKIKLHDRVSFMINGSEREFTVSSLREVDWQTFNINFFTVVPPGLLDKDPASWVTSLYLNPQQKELIAELVKRFPNVTVIDVESMMQRVRSIMDRISMAVEFIFLFSLLAGVVVLVAAIQSSQDERRYENAVMRTLGARKTVLLRGLYAEFITLGALAGLLAGGAAMMLGWLLAEQVFNFDYEFNFIIIFSGLMIGVILVATAGIAGTRSILNQAPVASLRQMG